MSFCADITLTICPSMSLFYLLVCFNLSTCQLICHSKDFSTCMLIRLSPCVFLFLPVHHLHSSFETMYSSSHFYYSISCILLLFFCESFTIFYFLYLKVTASLDYLLRTPSSSPLVLHLFQSHLAFTHISHRPPSQSPSCKQSHK